MHVTASLQTGHNSPKQPTLSRGISRSSEPCFKKMFPNQQSNTNTLPACPLHFTGQYTNELY